MKVVEEALALQEENGLLRERNLKLQARIEELETIIGFTPTVRLMVGEHRLTPTQKRILDRLLYHEVAPRETLYRLLAAYGNVTEKTLDVHISKLRRKLPPGVTIKADWGIGYYIPATEKAVLKGLTC